MAFSFLKKEKTMIFKNIHALLKSGVTLNFVIAAAGEDKIDVSILPSCEKNATGMQLVPKTFTATPDELDAQFADVLKGYCGASMTLQEQLAAMEAAAKQVATEAAAAAVSKAASKTSSSTKPVNRLTAGATAKSPVLLAEGGGEDDDNETTDGSEPETLDLGGGDDQASTPAGSEPQAFTL